MFHTTIQVSQSEVQIDHADGKTLAGWAIPFLEIGGLSLG